ncbi:MULTISPECIES: non-ribosomal peptide synthetase [Bacillus]|uniref:Thioester reductase n=2 Tax=Bacillus TaxID=1386 RepID=A0A0M3R9C1_9BACI|nr:MULTISPECIES: non-ribosomal peptide synthetase [Bacillus]ALC81182.1 thioester reductase [Bacillus gobiensis]MED1095542.1 non-ribosomal peptide synthetase [Bacillus capparidis]
MNQKECFSLTHPQKRIWYMENINPGEPLHNIGGIVGIKGNVDFTVLEEAINLFIKSNDGIRHHIVEADGNVRQYVEEYRKFHVRHVEFSCREDMDVWVRQEAGKPFPLYESNLFDFAFFTIRNSGVGGYFVKVHHMISDGWSMNLLTEQICNTYMKRLNGERIADQQRESYFSYLKKEEAYAASKRFEKNKQFWNEKFSVLPESLKSELVCADGKRKTFRLSDSQSNAIKQFAADHQVSVYAFFVALYSIYLHKATMQDELIIGMPVFNRSGKVEKNIFGMFTSTMPFRYRTDVDVSVREMVQTIHQELLRCYFHQKYPYELLIQDLGLKQRGLGDLFDTCINYYNTSLPNKLDGSPIENEEFYNGKQIYSLQVIVREWSRSGGFDLDFDYKVQTFNEHQIDHMYLSFTHIIDQILKFPNQLLKETEIISEKLKNELLDDFNRTDTDYQKEKTIHQLFEEQAEKTPNKAALILENEQLTYRELNEKSNQLARYLIKKKVQKGTIVGISTKHSIETIIGILGILKAGAAYVPIDPDYPSDRIHYMLQDSGISILLCNLDRSLFPYHIEVIELNSADIYKGDSSKLHVLSDPTDLAYIIYTSGSTGKPKGVMIEHQGLVNYICWAKKEYVGTSENEIFPFYSSLAFDLTVTSIFVPLISGNKIVIYPADDNQYVLYKIIREKLSTIIKLTPSHLSLLQDTAYDSSTIHTFIVGGEDLSVSLAKRIQNRFGRHIKIFNEYGPTETVVGCMIHQFDAEKDTGSSVPIGRPIQNTKIYLLDADLQPLPVGAVGEIFISGDGVSRGYLNKPELTQEKFFKNPYSIGERIYRSGDLARFVDENKIEYAGRIDHQIKIRGYRIERSEIENNLRSHPSIRDAIVIDRENNGGNRSLFAYYTEKQKVDVPEIIRYLKDRLPSYMIPSFFVPLKEIPLTINAKVNKEALPDPEITRWGDPDSEIEENLASVLRDVLGVDQVGMQDNFYHLGGDSIKAIQMASMLSDKGLRLKTKDILANPVIEDMTMFMEKSDNKMSESSNAPCSGVIQPLPSASWFFSQNLDNINHYTQSVLLKVTDDINIELLESALRLLIGRHDAFRLNYRKETKELYFNESGFDQKIELKSFDLSNDPDSEQFKRIEDIGEMLKASFRIEHDLLLKACMFDLGSKGKRVFLTAHHLAVDGISWRIILEDLNRIYEQMEEQREVYLPPKTDSIKQWAMELQTFSKRISDKEKQYWRDVYRHQNETITDFDLGQDRLESCESMVLMLSEEETTDLLQKANEAYLTKADELMIIALSIVTSDFFKKNQVLLEIEGHGREDLGNEIDVSRTVGWFTSLYPVLLKVEETDLSHQIKQGKEQLRQIPSKGLSHGVMKYLAGDLPGDNHKYIRFNYLGDFHASFSSGLFEFAEEYTGRESSHTNELDCLIDIIAYMVNGKLRFSLTYSQNKFKRESISQFAKAYMNQMRDVILHCCQRNHAEFTPSDFEAANLSSEDLENIFSE